MWVGSGIVSEVGLREGGLEGAPQDEPVREAHRVDQAGHLLEANALKKY